MDTYSVQAFDGITILLVVSSILHSPILYTPIFHTPILHTSIFHTPILHTPILHTPILHSPILHTIGSILNSVLTTTAVCTILPLQMKIVTPHTKKNYIHTIFLYFILMQKKSLYCSKIPPKTHKNIKMHRTRSIHVS